MPRFVSRDKANFLKKVSVALDRLLPAAQKIHLGVAVSGGPDSVALLHALVSLAARHTLSLTALHVNHGLRLEAHQEQSLVETLCQWWRIPCVVERLAPPQSRNGVEAWARAERYRCFQVVRERYALDAVALGHTLDDQAETVLFRLLRGSARRGLAGIPPLRDGWLIRPLLDCTRQEIMTYLAALGLPFATDASNTDLQYTRNRIRHRLLPLLEQEFSPQIRRHLAHLAKTFRTEEDWLEALTTVARERVQDTSETISLERLALEPFALRPRILRQWLEQTGQVHDVTFSQLKSLQDLSEGRAKGRVEVPGRFLVRRNRGHLLLERKGVLSGESSYCYLLSPGQELLITEGGWRVILSAPSVWSGLPHLARSSEPWQALFDADILPDRVVVRSFRQGDRICPLGMKGHKKVHDVFVDAKVPPRRRRSLPLVVIGAEVAWVPGCVRGELAKVTPVTRRVCRAEVSPLPGKYELC